jgi:ribosome-associated protein
LAATKRTNGDKPSKRKASDVGSARAERPRIPSSHGARSYAAKKSHGVRKSAKSAAGLGAAIAKSGAVGPRTKKARGGPSSSGAPSTSLASDEARETAIAIAAAALDKKALGVEILDVAGKVDYADFLVLMTGRSDRQVGALADGIEEALRKKNRRPISVEGRQKASWILMDFGDVVVHVFQDDARSLYDIEGLWLDARRLPVPLPDNLRD